MDAFEQAVREHDERLAALGLEVWVGSEPTFTDRWSERPEWLHQALGGDKEARARALLAGLARRLPGGVVLRTLGRQYPGEDLPRWSLGLYRRRDGSTLWEGPPDPLLRDAEPSLPIDLAVLRDALRTELGARDWSCGEVATLGGGFEERLLLNRDPLAALPDDTLRLLRPSVHAAAIPPQGLRDELAERGWHLLVLRATPAIPPAAVVELPAFAAVADFLAVLAALGAAANAIGLPMLQLSGFPPPVDDSVEWTTVTPDPAVIEINSAPDGTALGFLERARLTYGVAAEQGLCPYRLYYTGLVADSGGGGQITLGGRRPVSSPFLQVPPMLPRLVRYLAAHPALSYLYAHDYVGPGGQSVRSDERGLDAFDELRLTLRLLAAAGDVAPELLWRSLAPFLADSAGNSHRAEINIEKLWNPHLHGRGQLGLVEFRAFRMQHGPERATAIACLLRAVVALLARQDPAPALVDWGRELHDRYALPFHLEQDLLGVLDDLDRAGVGLGAPLRDVLLRDEFRPIAAIALPGCTLELSRAVECWPLVGDASVAQGSSRVVDASTARLQILLRPEPGVGLPLDGWELTAAGAWQVPLREAGDAAGPVRLLGLRYRSFVPFLGMHPTLGSQSPLTLTLQHPASATAHRVTLHDWRLDGAPYPGLPEDLDEAARRRQERLVAEAVPAATVPRAAAPPAESLTPWCLDLRDPAFAASR